MTSPDREPEPPSRKGPHIVPFDTTADAILHFDMESQDSEDADGNTSDESPLPRIATFPTDSAGVPSIQAPVAIASPAARNWRNTILLLLAVVVLAQGALMAYWMISGRQLAEVTPATGNVTITSEPVGSPIAIDGTVRGQSPLTIALDPGSHVIVVGSGAQARSQNISVTRGGEASMHVQLATAVAAAALATSGTLQIATQPPGARVWVDGEARGTAPITISNLKGGDHNITVRAGSGDPIKRTVVVQEGGTSSLVITMPGAGGFASGWLTVSSPVPLQVREKGELLGTTDMPRIMMPAGAHELELVNAGLGYRATRNVSIAGGETATFTINPPPGTLSVNAIPWAEVWIDGQRAGETPIGNYSIPLGTHELLFRHPELGEQRKTVTVGVQGPVRVGVDMKKP